MPQRDSGDAWIITLALGLGLMAVATPIAIRFLLPPPSVSAAEPARRTPTGARQPEDLRSRRLAFPGGCGVNEFKDHRGIEAQIRRKLEIHRLNGLEVSVSADCVTTLRGVVRSPAQRDLALKAASHPWAVLDARGLTLYSDAKPEPAAPAADQTEAR